MTTQIAPRRSGAPTKAVQPDPQQPPASPKDRLVCKPEVLRRVGVTYPTLWSWMRDGKFPRARELGGKTAWLESDIDRWIETRPVRVLKGDEVPVKQAATSTSTKAMRRAQAGA